MSFYPNRKNCKYVVYLSIRGYQSAYGLLTIYEKFLPIHSMEIYLLDISRDLDLSKPYLKMNLNIVEKNKPIYEILQLNNDDKKGKKIVSRINNQTSSDKNPKCNNNNEKPDSVVFKRIFKEKEEKIDEDKTFIDDSDNEDEEDEYNDKCIIEYKLCI